MERIKKQTLWNYDLQVLRSMLGMQVTEEQLQSIVERAIQEADLDQDNAISFDEFRKVNYRRETICVLVIHFFKQISLNTFNSKNSAAVTNGCLSVT